MLKKQRHFLVSIDEAALKELKEHYDVIEEQPGFTDEFFIWITLFQQKDHDTGAPKIFEGGSVKELTEAYVSFGSVFGTFNALKERPWEGSK